MTKQLSRIEAFVTSIIEKDFAEGQQSMVLSSDLGMVGGANSTCENAGTISCLGENKRCINYGTCSSDNAKDCRNRPPLTKD